MSNAAAQVDGYIRKNNAWQAELSELRRIALEGDLTEAVKWRVPCYTFEGGNVVILGAFKESCVFSFVKGALLKDAKKILVKPGENSQAVRVIRFTSVAEISKVEKVLKAYIREAIAIEKSGAKVPLKAISEHTVPAEMQQQLDKDAAFKTAFKSLTPGRQRAYLLYIAGAKQSSTRSARLEKVRPKIMAGKGLDD